MLFLKKKKKNRCFNIVFHQFYPLSLIFYCFVSIIDEIFNCFFFFLFPETFLFVSVSKSPFPCWNFFIHVAELFLCCCLPSPDPNRVHLLVQILCEITDHFHFSTLEFFTWHSALSESWNSAVEEWKCGLSEALPVPCFSVFLSCSLWICLFRYVFRF